MPGSDDEAQLIAASPDTLPAGGRRARVLVIDDEPMIGQVLARALASEHDAATVTTAREALRRLGEGERFDVILCDLTMPEMSGPELYDQLVERWPELAERVVFITGGAFTAQATAFLERVMRPHLAKPIDLDGLRRAVRSVIATAR